MKKSRIHLMAGCLAATGIVVYLANKASAEQRNVPRQERVDRGSIQEAGAFEAIPLDSNLDTLSVKEGLDKNLGERLSASILPRRFNRTAFNNDPGKYLHTIEPGRVFMTAQPAKDVPETRIAGRKYHEVAQGESIVLEVTSAPSSPITFSSLDAGAFENRLPSITVMTDVDGKAEAEFFGTSGTLGRCNVLAGCPEAWGQARYVVNVLPKRPL